MSRDYKLIIIGAGSGGLSAAHIAHNLKLDNIALIEKEDRLGGECLNSGCVPSKALLYAAKKGMNAKQAWGHVNSSIKTIEDHSDNDDHIRSLGIDIFHGAASFVDKHTLQVGDTTYTSDYFLITTGSSPFVPPIPGLDTVEYHTNETIFTLKKIPKSMTIVGSGPIGVEMATAFSALGTKVTLLERGERIMLVVDADAAALVRTELEAAGVEILTGVETQKISKVSGGVKVTLSDGSVTSEEILVSTGRIPHTNLDLENAGVQYGKRGIATDKYLRTTAKNIYAVGDVVAESPNFTHLASHQAGVAISNMLSPISLFSKNRLVPTPAITYSWPEVGSFGMPLDQAEAKSGSQTIHFDLSEVDRAITDETTNGFIKVVVDRWGKLLHGTVVAANASELLTPLLILHARRRSIVELSRVVIPYPTVAGALTVLAAQYSGKFVAKNPFWALYTKKWRR